MIKIDQTATRKVEVRWETGEDYTFLSALYDLIKARNIDKLEIKRLNK